MPRPVRTEGVPAENLRQAFVDSGLTMDVASLALEFRRRHDGKGDSVRLKRRLGFLPHRSHGRQFWVDVVDYDFAEKVVRAWNLDPVDYGL